MGFRNKRGNGCRDCYTGTFDIAFFTGNAAAITHLFAKFDNGVQIFIGFCGQSDHEIEFYLLPAITDQLADMVDKGFFGNAFVDDIAEPLTACFGSEGCARSSDTRHGLHDIAVHRADPQRWQGYGNLFFFAFFGGI